MCPGSNFLNGEINITWLTNAIWGHCILFMFTEADFNMGGSVVFATRDICNDFDNRLQHALSLPVVRKQL